MTADEILTAVRRRQRPDVEMCAMQGCYASRPSHGQPGNEWSLVCVGDAQYVFCPRCGPRKSIEQSHTPSELRRLKKCIDRCQWLGHAKDN
jgi:hypothetical protein